MSGGIKHQERKYNPPYIFLAGPVVLDKRRPE